MLDSNDLESTHSFKGGVVPLDSLSKRMYIDEPHGTEIAASPAGSVQSLFGPLFDIYNR